LVQEESDRFLSYSRSAIISSRIPGVRSFPLQFRQVELYFEKAEETEDEAEAQQRPKEQKQKQET
jgi:hypothetical protein